MTDYDRWKLASPPYDDEGPPEPLEGDPDEPDMERYPDDE